MKKISFFPLMRATFDHWHSHSASRMGAALSYYAIFSIAPFFILLIAMASLFFNKQLTEGVLFQSLQHSLGSDSTTFIQGLIHSATSQSIGFWGTLISVVTIIIGAFGVFAALNDALDELWKLPPRPKRREKISVIKKIHLFVKEKLMVFSIIPLVGIVLLFSVMISIYMTLFRDQITNLSTHAWIIIRIVEFVIAFGLTTVLFALIYKILPNIKLPWHEVFLGAIITSVLFLLGRILITFYLHRVASTSLYGAAGSLVALLIWIYYSAQVFFIGASFIFVYSQQYGFLKKAV